MSVQLIIIIVYFAATVAIGLIASKKSKSTDSFVGAGLGVLACVAAGTGEWLGGTSTTGVSEYGFNYGLAGSLYTITNGIGICFLAIFFAKLYRSLDTVTVPGIMGHFLGQRARSVASALLIFVMLAVGTSQVTAAGKLGYNLLGINFNLSVVILGIIFIIYTIAGGMNAVASTNIMHLFAMYIGIVLAIIVVGKQFGDLSWLKATLANTEVLSAGAPTGEVGGFFNFTNCGMPKATSWLIASILGACTAQAGIQPILAAKDGNTARKASFVTAVVVAPFGIFTALLGMYARACAETGAPGFADLAASLDGKQALNVLLLQINQPVIGGIVLASIFAAILSTVSPIILASGTMFSKDLYEKLSKKPHDDKKILLVARVSTAVAGLFTMVAAMWMNVAGIAILDMVYFAYTLRGSIFVVLLFAIFWKAASSKGAIAAMCCTAAVGGFWVIYKGVAGGYPIAPWFSETYAAVAAALIFTLLFCSIFKREDYLVFGENNAMKK